MRTRPAPILHALFPATRQAVLGTLLLHPEQRWYVRSLARHLALPPSSIQPELTALAEAGILKREVEGRQVYFQADQECPVFQDLQQLLVKTAGLVDVLRFALEPLRERIALAFVYGSLAKGTAVRSTSDVDLMVIGEDVGLSDVAPLLQEPQRLLAREVHPTVLTPDELCRKADEQHPFIRGVLDGEKLFVVGTQDELDAFSHRAPPRGRTTRNKGGTR